MSNARRFGGAGLRRGTRSTGAAALPEWSMADLTPDAWWRSDQWGVTINTSLQITAVADKSGNARHLAATGAMVAVTPDANFAGHDSIRFPNAPYLRASGFTLTNNGGGVGYTVIALVRTRRTTTQCFASSASATVGERLLLWANNDATPVFAVFAGAHLKSAVSPVANSTYFLMAEMNGATSKLFINDVVTPAASGNAGTEDCVGITLGATYAGVSAADAEGPEFIVIPRILTADEKAAIARSFQDWYGVTITGAAIPPGYRDVAQPTAMKVFVVAGQSNASGDPDGGTLASQTGYATQYAVPHSYNVNGSALGPIYMKEQAVDVYSAEIAIARRCIEAQQRCGFVKVSLGSTHLAAGAGSDWSPASTAELYDTMVTRVTDFLALVTDYQLAGFVWIQGEADAAVEAEANAYQTNLADLFSNVRTDLSAPSLPIVVQKLHPDWDGTSFTLTYHATVTAAQVAAVAADANATLISESSGSGLIVGDEIHRTGAQRLALGQLYADALGIP